MPSTSPACTAITTAPAGSREAQEVHPAELRRRTADLVARSTELGRTMRRADARRVVLAYWGDTFDGSADGWNLWLQRRFDPTQAAALANVMGGGLDAAS